MHTFFDVSLNVGFDENMPLLLVPKLFHSCNEDNYYMNLECLGEKFKIKNTKDRLYFMV